MSLAPPLLSSRVRRMKRRPLLIAACCFAAVSLGLNAWLLILRNQKPGPAPAAAVEAPHPATAAQALQPVHMDFSGTAFADDSWKLDDPPATEGALDGKPLKLEITPPASAAPAAPVSPTSP